MSERHLLTGIADGILTITLNRPEKINAYTNQMGNELIDAIDEADRNDDVRVVIVTGAGRGFCSGADISPDTGWFQNPTDKVRTDAEGGFSLRLFRCTKPIIAAINGAAMGVGVTMTLPMDIRIASDNAKFGFVFARRGLVPEAGSAFFLPRIVGLPKALQWVYTARVVEANEALQAGLVSELVAPEHLMTRARAIAREIADNTSAVAIALTRPLMWRAAIADDPMAALGIDSSLNRHLSKSPDVVEGIAAFREKRAPKFPGRPSKDMPPQYPWW